MNFKYTEKEVQSRIWTHPGGLARVSQTKLPIPEYITVRNKIYPVTDLFLRVTKSQYHWLNPDQQKLSEQGRIGQTGRKSKYDAAAWAWIRTAEPQAIAEHYKITLAYAQQLKKLSTRQSVN